MQTVSRCHQDGPHPATLGADLAKKAKDGDLDIVFGRDSELQSLIDILGKRRSNNPILIGPPGASTALLKDSRCLSHGRRSSALCR